MKNISMQIFFIFGQDGKRNMGGVAGMKKARHWVLPAIWAILLMLLLGGAVWAYQAFSVAD